MSHFYGRLQGSRGEATRGGSKSSGFVSYMASWQGAVRVSLHYNEKTGQDYATVSLEPWHGSGTTRTLYNGPVSGESDKREEESEPKDTVTISAEAMRKNMERSAFNRPDLWPATGEVSGR